MRLRGKPWKCVGKGASSHRSRTPFACAKERGRLPPMAWSAERLEVVVLKHRASSGEFDHVIHVEESCPQPDVTSLAGVTVPSQNVRARRVPEVPPAEPPLAGGGAVRRPPRGKRAGALHTAGCPAGLLLQLDSLGEPARGIPPGSMGTSEVRPLRSPEHCIRENGTGKAFVRPVET
jgi:hypothetical protein